MEANQRAVIYARVSSLAQLKKGDGLASQESRCREYARFKGYEVVEVFQDNKSGGDADRPAMMALLDFLSKQSETSVVIIDDINRFARDVVGHWQLRAMLAEAGGKLESPSIEFGEDSDSILVENLLASVSQHQRQKNGEQTKNRMRGRALNGYWVFRAPIGYKFQRVSGHGNMLVRDEPMASIIQEALEGFASRRFETQAEVKRFLESQPIFPKDFDDGTIRFERVIRLMTRIHFAGYIEIPDWDVSLRKGHHEGLISLETYETIQQRIKEGARAPARKDINADFPLRGFVCCDDCGTPLTACWSTSKSGKKHPYYLCHAKGCPSYRKSIRRDVLEGEFATLMQGLAPSEGIFAYAKGMFKDAWSQRSAQAEANRRILRNERDQLTKQIEAFMDRIVEADSPTIITAYEKRIEKMERTKLILDEKLEKQPAKAHTFEQLFEHAMQFLSNPWKLWESENLLGRKNVLRLAFADRISYSRENGLRTPKTTLPFKVLEGFSINKKIMAERQGCVLDV
ncbi:recombinase family protein [Thalassobius sp. Cn5-15]|uniref:recombinase family protein n=1 Tax=Thalassobius sp. Cn5-15 TaxID=2917763 RepID=UPI001EF345B8|nr:recombinase family protein [Thalassobius sp. Cn5-15]MCG7492486.1 recombinase family protein [Thalassobius sp. Cn5-15]